jgi:hypothetical protein
MCRSLVYTVTVERYALVPVGLRVDAIPLDAIDCNFEKVNLFGNIGKIR